MFIRALESQPRTNTLTALESTLTCTVHTGTNPNTLTFSR